MFSTLIFVLPFLQVALLAAVPERRSLSRNILSPSQLNSQCSRAHTVQEGDICDSISESQNSPTFQLALANLGVIDDYCTNLQVGQQICLALTNFDCQQTYVVRDSDTCHSIAFRLGLDSNVLFANNPQIDRDCSNIYSGEVLCASHDVFIAPNTIFAPSEIVHGPAAIAPSIGHVTPLVVPPAFNNAPQIAPSFIIPPAINAPHVQPVILPLGFNNAPHVLPPVIELNPIASAPHDQPSIVSPIVETPHVIDAPIHTPPTLIVSPSVEHVVPSFVQPQIGQVAPSTVIQPSVEHFTPPTIIAPSLQHVAPAVVAPSSSPVVLHKLPEECAQ